MKRISILMCVALVLVLSVPVFAADWSVTGSLKNTVTYEKETIEAPADWTGKSELAVHAGVTVDNAKITLDTLAAFTKKFGDEWEKTPDTHERVWVTVTGPYRTGGQDLTTVIGDYWHDPSDAWRTGVKVSDLVLCNDIKATAYWWAQDGGAVRGEFAKGTKDDEFQATLNAQSALETGKLVGNAWARYELSPIAEIQGEYKTSGYLAAWGTVDANDNLSLYGKVDSNEDYNVNGTMTFGDDVPLSPTATVGYKKVDVDSGVYAKGTAVLTDSLKTQVKYNYALKNETEFVAGSGSIYDQGAADPGAVDPFNRTDNSKKTGYVGIYNTDSEILTLATRFNVKDLVDLGVSDDVTITAKGMLKNDVAAGELTQNKLGVEVGTTTSFAGFDDVFLEADVIADLLANGDTDVILTAKYTAPNGVALAASHTIGGEVKVTGSHTVKF